MTDPLQDRFHAAMLNIYERALSETNYRAVRFLHMVGEMGGLQAARVLLHAQNVSDGYTALWERARLDLTVEALILDSPAYHSLFTKDELEICRKRLAAYKYPGLTTAKS